MILADTEIRKLVKEKAMIVPFDEKKLQAVSYDISSSDIVMAYQSLDKAVDLRNKKQMELVTRKIDITKGYHIKPNEYLLVKTKEKFFIPANMTAHVRPRTTFNRFGLVVSDQHMNPNFKGYLYLGLYNATPNIIDIYPDLAIAQMVFEEVTGDITETKLYDRKKAAKYQDEDDFVTPSLDDDISDTERKKVDAFINALVGR
ncbi:dCTP deaminase [Selenomonas sputigena]|jgi:dCTP deaminase|uniref:DeoxyUTP pyrophosphatase n=1 Tax=Selenomonas sputigena (strain ATCC 35185 / DSM 20758 / CCUG 44933 / VPI D19B-28) TaxID=546271 RepID=C9LYM7_SELS3|nr:dCTP deaminase [Selenomonas sputigena]AEC00996.1 deoxyUTP pyrophosphatase [Selenomonas sputigena ATCC 35185]EEX75977.1 putative dCTP deaminase [Selenomonas sputigena ATCC 35185]